MGALPYLCLYAFMGLEGWWIKSRKSLKNQNTNHKNQKNKYRNFKSEIRREYNIGARERKTKKCKILLGTGPYMAGRQYLSGLTLLASGTDR